MRRGFTLMELLVVMMIIAIIAGLAIAALSGTTEIAREQRTRAIVAKLDQLIMERWEHYRTLRMPVRAGAGTNARLVARARLDMLRETMRLELPSNRQDVLHNPVFLPPGKLPAVTRQYRRKVTAGWNDTNMEAECLWLIMGSMHDGDKNALDFFGPEEIGDLDQDGVPEILDGWGRPMLWLRWAPGYTAHVGKDGQWGVAGLDDNGDGTVDDVLEAGATASDDYVCATAQTRNGSAPDPFDPLDVDPRVDNIEFPPNSGSGHGLPLHKFPNDFSQGYPLDNDPYNETFALRPLIWSMGRDGESGINLPTTFSDGTPFNYALTTPPNDPYYGLGNPAVTMHGAVLDVFAIGDNITNHYYGD